MLAYLENLMDVTDMIIHRSKQLSTDLNIPHTMKRCLSEHEASLCNNFARVINAAKELVQTKFKSYEAVFKLLIRFYTSLDLLTKHFIIRFKTLKECVTTSRSVFKPESQWRHPEFCFRGAKDTFPNIGGARDAHSRREIEKQEIGAREISREK